MMVEVVQIRMMFLNPIQFGHNGNPHGGVLRLCESHGSQPPHGITSTLTLNTSRLHCTLKIITNSAGGVVELGRGRASPATPKFQYQHCVGRNEQMECPWLALEVLRELDEANACYFALTLHSPRLLY